MTRVRSHFYNNLINLAASHSVCCGVIPVVGALAGPVLASRLQGFYEPVEYALQALAVLVMPWVVLTVQQKLAARQPHVHEHIHEDGHVCHHDHGGQFSSASPKAKRRRYFEMVVVGILLTVVVNYLFPHTHAATSNLISR